MPFPLLIPLITAGLGALGNIAGKASAGAAAGRQAEAQTLLSQDQLKNQQYSTQQQALIQSLLAAESANMNRANLDLTQREYALKAPNARGATAVRGDMMSRAQDVNIPDVTGGRIPIAHVSGGMRPSMLSPQTQQLGQSMTRNALTQQLAGDSFSPVAQQNWGGAVMAPPTMNALPEAGAGSSWMNALTGIGSAGALIQAILDAKNKQVPVPVNPSGGWGTGEGA